MNDNSKMSFMDHLEELRHRLIICLVSIFAGMIICWFFREAILDFLLAPLYEAWSKVDGLAEPEPLNFSSMLEPFIAYLKLAAIGGLFLSSPVILFQLWSFISPGLYKKEKKLAFPFVIISTLLFAAGSVTAYSLVFPIGFEFFLEFASGQSYKTYSSNIAASGKASSINTIFHLDAGIADAGRTEEKNIKKINPSKAARNKSDTNSYNFASRVSQFFSDKNCVKFWARRIEKNKSKLNVEWDLIKCKTPPADFRLTKNETPVHLEWTKQKSKNNGIIIFNAIDNNAGISIAGYEISIPSVNDVKRLAPVLMVKDYLSFAIRILLAFGLVFELPIIILFLSFAGIVNYKQLLRFSKWFVIISFIASAMLTPPDIITQILLAAPLIALYFVSVFVSYLFRPKP